MTLATNKSRSFGLDLVRASAVSMVLIAHFAKTYEHFGFWGVELFFSLSGYLIGNILWKSYSSSQSWRVQSVINFWSRRWWRTLPNYFLFLGIMTLFHFHYDRLPAMPEYIEFLWFGQSFTSHGLNFFGVSWSLCVEEWFYLLFPTALYILDKPIKTAKSQVFILTLLIFIIIPLLLREYYLQQGHSVRGITTARLDAIAFGVLIAYFFNNKNSVASRLTFFFIGILLLIWSLKYMYLENIAYESVKSTSWILSTTPFAFACMLPLLELIPVSKFSMITKGITKLSLWSYSIYLCHIPVLFVTYDVLDPIRSNIIGNMISKSIAFALTLIVSSIIYNKLELPLIKMRPKALFSKTSVDTKDNSSAYFETKN